MPTFLHKLSPIDQMYNYVLQSAFLFIYCFFLIYIQFLTEKLKAEKLLVNYI